MITMHDTSGDRWPSFRPRGLEPLADREPLFTGEQFIPGRTEARIAQDHFARYAFAASFVGGLRVLDIASGVGYGTAMLADAGAAAVDGIDLAPDIVDFAARRYTRPNVRFAIGDISTYQPPAQPDIVTCFETIEHVDDYEGALRNLSCMLEPEGVLLISSPNRLVTSPGALSLSDPPHNPFHRREFSIAELTTALEQAGFKVAPESVYGQRQQRAIVNRAVRRVYTKLFLTKHLTSATVSPVTRAMPRYIVIKAIKERRVSR